MANNKIVLTLRITEKKEIDLLNNLKRDTWNKTFAGALMRAAADFMNHKKEVAGLQDEIKILERKLRSAEEVLQFLHHASKMLDGYGKKWKGKYPE